MVGAITPGEATLGEDGDVTVTTGHKGYAKPTSGPKYTAKATAA